MIVLVEVEVDDHNTETRMCWFDAGLGARQELQSTKTNVNEIGLPCFKMHGAVVCIGSNVTLKAKDVVRIEVTIQLESAMPLTVTDGTLSL